MKNEKMIHRVLFLSLSPSLFFSFFFASFSSHFILCISRETRALTTRIHTRIRAHTHTQAYVRTNERFDFSFAISNSRDGLIINRHPRHAPHRTYIRNLIIIDKEVHAKLRLLRSY